MAGQSDGSDLLEGLGIDDEDPRAVVFVGIDSSEARIVRDRVDRAVNRNGAQNRLRVRVDFAYRLAAAVAGKDVARCGIDRDAGHRSDFHDANHFAGIGVGDHQAAATAMRGIHAASRRIDGDVIESAARLDRMRLCYCHDRHARCCGIAASQSLPLQRRTKRSNGLALRVAGITEHVRDRLHKRKTDEACQRRPRSFRRARMSSPVVSAVEHLRS